MKGRISKRSVEALQPVRRDVKCRDGTTGKGVLCDSHLWDKDLAGFGVKATPAETRIYILQYRVGRRLRCYKIGRHGSPWSPDEARQEAHRLLGVIASGGDPAQDRADSRHGLTVAELCDLYLAEGCPTKKASSVKTDQIVIRCHVKPLLGNRVVAELTRGDVERFLQDIAKGKTARDQKQGFRARSIVKGGQGIATRTVALLSAMLTFAVGRDIRPDNPARGVKLFKVRSCNRFLSADELATLGQALADAEAEGANPFGVAAIRLLALTGCRKSEILRMRWDEVNMELGFVHLADSKTGAKVVQLGTPALRVLESLPRMAGNLHVLPGRGDGSHFVGLQKFWDGIRAAAGLDDVRLHDLRHSFASVGAVRGDSLLLIGKLLGHTKASTTERYAHLANDPMKAAAEGIAKTIEAAMAGSPGKLVPMRKRHA